MQEFEKKYLKYKKKYLELKNIIQAGGSIGDIKNITGDGPLSLVINAQKDNKFEIKQGKNVADIVRYVKICRNPQKYIFVSKSGSVYIYEGNIHEGITTSSPGSS